MDKNLLCVGCTKEFIFTEGEQAFYEEKQFTEPKRCPDCRKQRKQMRGKINEKTFQDRNEVSKDGKIGNYRHSS